MQGLLQKGVSLTSKSGNSYTVEQRLGVGGQGEVYKVTRDGCSYALKWYFKNSATNSQRQVLVNLIKKGAPSNVFLWPQEFLSMSENSFGYIMPLRPDKYKSIVDMMKRRAEPSFATLCRAAFNLAQGYNKLHAEGFAYRDISFGNVFFDPDNGDVLICDNDNVSAASGISSVYGTPRFMAPEIITGKAKPSRNTDLFSLAVLLFYMFMLNHPLEGRQEAKIKCMDIHAMNKLFGTNPIFIFDPNNDSNRPVEGLHDNATTFWPIYPQKLRDLFSASFTDGLSSPGKRVTEGQWMDIFINMMFGIVNCSCAAEVFYDESIVGSASETLCWYCNKPVNIPVLLASGKSSVIFYKNTNLYAHHVTGNYDIETVIGTTAQNPNNPSKWGIRNDSGVNWMYIKPDGTSIPVHKGKSAAIIKGAKIDFGQIIGEFK